MIIRGTTPTIIFTFSEIDPSQITKAVLCIKQKCLAVITKDLTSAEVGDGTLSWTLSQEDTLSLANKECKIGCDWLLSSGVRGRSRVLTCRVGNPETEAIL